MMYLNLFVSFVDIVDISLAFMFSSSFPSFGLSFYKKNPYLIFPFFYHLHVVL